MAQKYHNGASTELNAGASSLPMFGNRPSLSFPLMVSSTFLHVLVSSIANVSPGSEIKVSRPHGPNHGNPAMISVFLSFLTINCCAELIRQFLKLFLGIRFPNSVLNFLFKESGLFARLVEAEKMMTSPFIPGASK